jgi:superfamily II DNA or RNA helicase
MNAPISNIHTKIMRRSILPDEYKIYRAALEWDLIDPIVIETRDDFKSEYRWKERLDPYHHQVTNLITFCRRLPVTLLADDVGLGKTISAGLIASELIARSRVQKMLIVCPKILGPQWKSELEDKFNIPGTVVTGSELIDAEPEESGAIITTYHTARNHLQKIPEDRFQMLVLDEAHKLRNLYGVEKPPQVALRFREALEQRRFRYVLMLTATPIQNRLWDLYSLVDLLTVARGHQNPFGSEGIFARKFIADDRDKARRLKLESQEEFRSIVYGYMSRVRRADAKLIFPDRTVQLHRVDPTPGEQDLIKAIAKPIQKLSILAQIGILQALVSSPEALQKQLNNMAYKGTVPKSLADAVNQIVPSIGISAKLRGLSSLIEALRKEQPENWRAVIFTTRQETQTTIQNFLEKSGVSVGIINGSSGHRNQDTIARFKKSPPACHVIVSTEAGSEGVNLQAANVVLNYDLPWNPMVVEQRIGRVQRLGSEYKNVSILNMVLRNTFEEYIVGRLMEKLQMATHAIGDIDSLLQASGVVEDESDDEAGGFEKKILQLVLDSLAGKNVEEATRKEIESIEEAKTLLEKEKENIDAMLSNPDGIGYDGPRAPKLPPMVHSMEAKEFTVAALKSFGWSVSTVSPDLYRIEQNSARELIRFNHDTLSGDQPSTLYTPGSPAFQRLVTKTIATGSHQVSDKDFLPLEKATEAARSWIAAFNGIPSSTKLESVCTYFEGKALVRVRATVAHDSYERLVEIPCSPIEHNRSDNSGKITSPNVIENVASVAIHPEILFENAKDDAAISEFCRFYLERREQEITAGGSDGRKRKKLEDEFTPRLEMTIVGLEGQIYRQIKLRVGYKIDSNEYTSDLTITPNVGRIDVTPEICTCAKTQKQVPADCLKRCAMSGNYVLSHLLIKSDLSDRYALPEHTFKCSVSGKTILLDEAELSSLSNQVVAIPLMKTSALSGTRGEPEYFGRCEFTGADVLKTELSHSEYSGKKYRIDERQASAVSGKTGHRSEFLFCHETRQPIFPSEAEKCEVTGAVVRTGMLDQCELSKKRVLPSQLSVCAVTRKRVLKRFLVSSSISEVPLIERVAVKSFAGNFCAPSEARPCLWSGKKHHPDDLRTCGLTDIPIYFEFVTDEKNPRLRPLVELLDGFKRTSDGLDFWAEIVSKVSKLLRRRNCNIESAILSPNENMIAACSEVRALLGFKIRHVGLVYSKDDRSIIGRIAIGARTAKGWQEKKQVTRQRND